MRFTTLPISFPHAICPAAGKEYACHIWASGFTVMYVFTSLSWQMGAFFITLLSFDFPEENSVFPVYLTHFHSLDSWAKKLKSRCVTTPYSAIFARINKLNHKPILFYQNKF
jgi:hypothetical protein